MNKTTGIKLNYMFVTGQLRNSAMGFARNVQRNCIRIFEHLLMRGCRANRADNTLTDTGDNGFFGSPPNQLIKIGAHRDSRLHFELDAIFGNCVKRWTLGFAGRTVDDPRVDTRLHRSQNVASGQINCASLLES